MPNRSATATRQHAIASMPFPITPANVKSYWKAKGVAVWRDQECCKWRYRTTANLSQAMLDELSADLPLLEATRWQDQPEAYDASNVVTHNAFKRTPVDGLHSRNRLAGRLSRAHGVEQVVIAGSHVAIVTEQGSATLFVIGAPIAGNLIDSPAPTQRKPA